MASERLKRVAKTVLHRAGYTLARADAFHLDMDEGFRRVYRTCAPYTMTSLRKMFALYQAINYIVDARLPGDIVECGVWRGGSSMLAAMTLAERGDTSRRVFLYDTFEGMPEPDERDVSLDGKNALSMWANRRSNGESRWVNASLPEVEANLSRTGYPFKQFTLVKGKVEETIPATSPEQISVLRLDTDFFQSTLHELTHLYPLLVERGVLIVDDYGHWRGATEATDQYLREQGDDLLLTKIDFSGRMAIKAQTR